MTVFNTRRTTGYRVPSGPVPAPTAPPTPPATPVYAVRTAAKPPRVLVLSETQGLFLGFLKGRDGRSVTLSPCRRLCTPGNDDIQFILYGLPHEPDDGVPEIPRWLPGKDNIPEVTILDAVVVLPTPE